MHLMSNNMAKVDYITLRVYDININATLCQEVCSFEHRSIVSPFSCFSGLFSHSLI